jgi:N-methylhydantoinase B
LVKVITPRGTIVNPNFPAAVSNANINTAQRIADVVLGAMAKVLPERAVAASAGTMALFTIGGISPRTGKYYSYVETYGGGQGAVDGLDGMDGVHTNMTNTRNTPVEVIENAYPLMVKRYGLVPDSEGAGQYRGGLGMVREITVVDHEAAVTLSTERASIKPWGINGGLGGANSVCRLLLADGEVRNLPDKITCTVPANSTIVYITPGGGGYGPPPERSSEAVREDVLEGLVSPERAKDAYRFSD